MKGTYVVLLNVAKDSSVKIGSLGRVNFRKGNYVYVGSALNSIEKRPERHLRKEKKLFWHIDYLLEKADIVKIMCFESGKEECNLARELSNSFESVRKFGCSDCTCPSHLFYSELDMEKIAEEIIKNLRDHRLRHWVLQPEVV